jgi:hypothetical protein
VRFNLIEDEPETGDFVTAKGITRTQEMEELNSKLANIEEENPWIIEVLCILEGYENGPESH